MSKITIGLIICFTFLTQELFSQKVQNNLSYNIETKEYTFQINDTLSVLYGLKGSNISYHFNKTVDTLGYYSGVVFDTISFVEGKDSVVVIRKEYSNHNIIIEIKSPNRFLRLITQEYKETIIEIYYPDNLLVLYKYDKKARLESVTLGLFENNRYKIREQRVYYKNGNVHSTYVSSKGYDVSVKRYRKNGKEKGGNYDKLAGRFLYEYHFGIY